MKDTKELKSDGQSISIRFIRTGLGFGVLSTIIPFIIGFISAKGMMGTEIYRTFVFTFLHLQYNGWFLFVVFGLFFKLLENKSIAINIKSGRIFYWLSALNVIPSISLSLLGMSYYPTIAFIGILSSTLLFASIIYYGRSFSIKNLLNKDANSVWSKTFLLIFLTSFILKTLLQSLSIIDSLTNIVFNNRWIIIAYLHLTMIGMFSFFFIYYMVEKTWIRITSLSKNGFITLILGFVSSECLMIAIGLTNANLYIPLLISSIMMAIGILLVLLTPIITCETSHAIFDNKKK
ncbi:MAG: hypothetical protein H6598_04665 [Flavobacteriales bacterium]|nr:hypothetical protein [Flavobacteriales bacterium]